MGFGRFVRSVPKILFPLGCFLFYFRGGGNVEGSFRVFLESLRRVIRDLDSEFLRFISYSVKI